MPYPTTSPRLRSARDLPACPGFSGRVPRLTSCLPVLGVLLLAGCSPGGAPKAAAPRDETVPVTLAAVELVPMDRTLTVVGTLTPMSEAAIAAQVEGQIENTKVDFGDSVKAGQDLARIDTASYQALANQAAATLAKAKASQLNAEQNLRRVTELQVSKISSTSELESATAQAEQARAEVKAAEAAEVIARLNLERSHVKAPFAGTISERIVNTGDYVKAAAPLFRIVDDGELKYLVQAPERYAGQVKAGQEVRFTVDAWPAESFTGQVFLVSPSVSTTTRGFNVAARVPNEDRKLKANSFARGEILLEHGVPTAVVPLDAVVNFAGVTKVFVIDGGVARSREIKTGRVEAGRMEILEGLKAGEQVAASGVTKLFDNAKIRSQATDSRVAGKT